MAKIVLGLGASHSPLLVLAGPQWEFRAEDDRKSRALNTLDGRMLSYEDLISERGEVYRDRCDPTTFPTLAIQAEYSLDRLARRLEAVRPDVVIVIGDDQGELFGPENQPAISIYHGGLMTMRPFDALERVPAWATKEFWSGYRMDLPHKYPVDSKLALEVTYRLIENGVDVASLNSIQESSGRGFGHAFGFVLERLMTNLQIPMIPILLNTYFPPNTPTARRCYEIGRKLRTSIEETSSSARVAIVASGGLSHFLCEEAWDREILDALKNRNIEKLIQIPQAALMSGSSEVRNWLCVAGAVEQLQMDYVNYIPVYRTPVGTGIGLGFATWS